MRTLAETSNVRAVLNHLVGENYMFTTVVAGQPLPDMSGETPDLVGNDPSGASRASLDAALSAWRSPGAMRGAMANGRFPVFATEVPLPPDAPAAHQLVAYLGRTP